MQTRSVELTGMINDSPDFETCKTVANPLNFSICTLSITQEIQLHGSVTVWLSQN